MQEEHCYMCAPLHLRFDDSNKHRAWPLREVVKEGVTYTPEATTTYTLSCGHTII